MREFLLKARKVSAYVLGLALLIALTVALTFLGTRYYDHRVLLSEHSIRISALEAQNQALTEKLSSGRETKVASLYDAVPVEPALPEVQEEKRISKR